VSWSLLIALGLILLFDLAYHLIPLGIPWLTVRHGVIRLIKQFSAAGFTPDVVIGAGRAGSIVGAMIAGNMGHRTFISVDVQHKHNGARWVSVNGPLRLETAGVDPRRILVTFAYIKTSETADAVKNYLESTGLDSDLISYATLFEDPEAPDLKFATNYYVAFRRRVKKEGWGALPWSATDRYDYR
jgi:hypoxanthine phosphoribosyltransferase